MPWLKLLFGDITARCCCIFSNPVKQREYWLFYTDSSGSITDACDMLENHLQTNRQGHSMSLLQCVTEQRRQLSCPCSSNQEKLKLLLTGPCIPILQKSRRTWREDLVTMAMCIAHSAWRNQANDSCAHLTLFVQEGSSLLAAVWSCWAKIQLCSCQSVTWQLLCILKQCMMKAAKLWVLCPPEDSFCSPKCELSFLASVPLLIFSLRRKCHVMTLDWLAKWALVYRIIES